MLSKLLIRLVTSIYGMCSQRISCTEQFVEYEKGNMLDYCTRYYERQFITRENKNKAILGKMERLLDDYIISGKLRGGKLPATEDIAEELNLSAAYFNDLLKFETGKTLESYFQLKRLDAAKQMLLQAGNTPAAVARQLGYPSVQHFSLIFKEITGVAPNDYRHSQN